MSYEGEDTCHMRGRIHVIWGRCTVYAEATIVWRQTCLGTDFTDFTVFTVS
jgi:hypothetical protein